MNKIIDREFCIPLIYIYIEHGVIKWNNINNEKKN